MTTKLIPSPLTAERLGIAPQTLRLWRMQGRGPRYVRLSVGRVAYDEREIERWLAARTFGSTAEESARDVA
jgi:predicted DNA-binding transcriptional regulator AlpA